MTHPGSHPDSDLPLGSTSPAHRIATLLDNLAQARARHRVRQLPRPFVTLAYAQSLDGSITVARGQRYRLSGPEALRLTHALRARHDAILVGVGTVLADDPELRVRLVDGTSPRPVVVDSNLRTPATARLLARAERPVWIAAAGADSADSARFPAPAPANDDEHERRGPLERLGPDRCRILDCPALPNGWVDLSALLRRLAADGVEHLMVEGGARIITSFLETRLIDYVVVTIAPQFLGGLAAVGPAARAAMPSALAHLEGWVSCRLGDDLVLAGEVAWPAG